MSKVTSINKFKVEQNLKQIDEYSAKCMETTQSIKRLKMMICSKELLEQFYVDNIKELEYTNEQLMSKINNSN